ncbi:MAG: hypothetical protein U1A27_14330 [Phycisphaerae bacterium]
MAGCDARRNYCGYAGIEGLRRRHSGAGQVLFRGDLVTVADDVVADFAAGRVAGAEADRLFAALSAAFEERGFLFHAMRGGRGLMLAPDEFGDVACTPAIDMLGRARSKHWPTGPRADGLRGLMRSADEVLTGHAVNRLRVDAGSAPLNALWLWGQGVPPRLRRFREQFGLRGAAVGRDELFRGVAAALGWPTVGPGDDCDDATAPGTAALAALDEHELVVVHLDRPLEAALAGDVSGKLRAIEQADSAVIAPLLARLQREPHWSLAVACDVPAYVQRRGLGAEPVPFCVCGSAPFGLGAATRFTESAADDADLVIEHGWELMEYVLRS